MRPTLLPVAAVAVLIVSCSGAASAPGPPASTDSGAVADAAGLDAAPLDTGAAPMDGGEGGSDAGADALDGSQGDAAVSDASLADAPVADTAGAEGASDAPSIADNPPVPAGWVLVPQPDVTPDMTAWATAILNDPATYPMFSTATKTFGTLTVLARVEWHPPDFQNGAVHRGVTLYEPAG
jgi:hypothetical protein